MYLKRDYNLKVRGREVINLFWNALFWSGQPQNSLWDCNFEENAVTITNYTVYKFSWLCNKENQSNMKTQRN